MGTPSILLAGLRLKKILWDNAPEEHKLLGPAIEKFCEHASPQRAPQNAIVEALSDAFTTHNITVIVHNREELDFALGVFASAIEASDYGRSELHALRCAISLYRSRINLLL